MASTLAVIAGIKRPRALPLPPRPPPALTRGWCQFGTNTSTSTSGGGGGGVAKERRRLKALLLGAEAKRRRGHVVRARAALPGCPHPLAASRLRSLEREMRALARLASISRKAAASNERLRSKRHNKRRAANSARKSLHAAA